MHVAITNAFRAWFESQEIPIAYLCLEMTSASAGVGETVKIFDRVALGRVVLLQSYVLTALRQQFEAEND